MIDVNLNEFLSPNNMKQAIEAECIKSGQPVPATTGELLQCIYYSLALSYKLAIEDLQRITGHSYTGINIVGGGCKDQFLNELTAKATGLPVRAGPSEATIIGNLIAQMLSAGEFLTLKEARSCVAESFEASEYLP